MKANAEVGRLGVAVVVAARAKRVRLNTSAFDRVAREAFGVDSDAKVAERLGMDKASLSLVRQGRRDAPHSMVIRVQQEIPGADLDEIFQVLAPDPDAA